MSSELGVDDFVRPGAERARTLHSPQDVGPTRPTVAHERALHDDGCAGAHRGHRGPDPRLIYPRITCDFDNGMALLSQMIDKGPLVGEPTLGKNLQQRIVGLRLLRFAASNGGIESRQVTALEVADEVGGAEEKCIPDLSH